MSHVTLIHIADPNTSHLPQEHHWSSRDHHPQTTHVRDNSIHDPLTAHGTNTITHDLPTAWVTNVIETFWRIFLQTQAKPPTLLVPYIWAATSTLSATATKHYVGRSCHLCTAQHQQQTGHQIQPVSNLSPLAAFQGLQQLQPWPTSHLLWMWSSHSQSSDLSFSSESIRHSPLTILIYGRSTFIMQIYCMNMNTYLLVFILVSILTSSTSYGPKHLPAVTPS